ncbi:MULTISPECIES: sporulation histidine kinase inhibitor Sda [Paenibacillus]|uniref:sporulation histidine kinase inhibitor Sda n=1 Tax=Paenibacillus TaxID=44249 RepID=UPI00203FB4A7|nr:sporulation histidine kinase inhibitor Sda [Paenibacillus camelliae]
MRTLSDEQMKELYIEAVSKDVDSDFIQLIVIELQRRGLGVHMAPSKLTEHQYTA